MPYTVTAITSLYPSHLPRVDHASEIEEYLTKMEKKGYQLHSVLPDHQVWKTDGNPAGKVETMLVLYKP
jgi:hypothetical protein